MRSGFSILTLAMASMAILASGALAAPGDDTEQFPWEGEVTGMNVYVRSGPGVNYYPSTKLNTGDRVLVSAQKFGWYRIVPPPGSFSYIDAAAVKRSSDGRTGQLVQDRVYVRAGSALSSRKTSTQMVLAQGATVEILGEADGFYKITPPHGAKLFISRQFLKLVPPRLRTGLMERYMTAERSASRATTPQIPPAPHVAAASPGVTPLEKSPAGPAPTPVAADITGTEGGPSDADGPPLMARSTIASPDRQPAASGETSSPSSTTDPVVDASVSAPGGPTGRYEALLALIEGELAAVMQKPNAAQDLQSLQPRYEEIATQTEETLPAQIAKIRLRQLRDLRDVRAERIKLTSDFADLDVFRSRMNDRRMEIMRRRAEEAMEAFDLEGELRQSYAFAPEMRRFRLVDPENQTTIAYVDIPRRVMADVAPMIGRVVGIRTATQRFSSSARVPIAVARSVTDLAPRRAVPGVITPDLSSNGANMHGETAKSSAEAARSDWPEDSSADPVLIADQDAEGDG